jgi:sugar O-acyltransferase (sialic acid O-acetyltransferase NeuD family)
MTKRALIIGAGGHAHVVGSLLHANDMKIHGYLDSSYVPSAKEIIKHAPLIGRLENIENYPPDLYAVYIAVGDNQKRCEFFEHAFSKGYEMPLLKHPTALIEPDCKIGNATQICIGSIVATEVEIGDGVIINSGSSIDHESKIGAFTHIAPGVIVAGRVVVGQKVFVGMGARIAQGLRVGDGAVIGAGSIILKDVPPGAKVLGIYH